MDKKVDAYIEKQKSPHKEICQKLRKIIFAAFPGINEEMKWGVPAYANGAFYFVALKTHVNVGFSLQSLSEEEIALLQGSGKTVKHMELSSLDEIDEGRIVELMQRVRSR